jgi:hypothetical protein
VGLVEDCFSEAGLETLWGDITFLVVGLLAEVQVVGL